jgi:hypothetical protein
MDIFEHGDGRIMVGEPAGGTGGGATSYVVRPATPSEVTRFHADRVQAAEAAVATAQDHLALANQAHAAHLATLPKPEPTPEELAEAERALAAQRHADVREEEARADAAALPAAEAAREDQVAKA